MTEALIATMVTMPPIGALLVLVVIVLLFSATACSPQGYRDVARRGTAAAMGWCSILGRVARPPCGRRGAHGRRAPRGFGFVARSEGSGKARPGSYTATVLQPGWYGPVHSRTRDATAAGYSASVSQVPIHNGTYRDSRKPTRNEQASGSSPLVGSLFTCVLLASDAEASEDT
jgi:hypothetical protein